MTKDAMTGRLMHPTSTTLEPDGVCALLRSANRNSNPSAKSRISQAEMLTFCIGFVSLLVLTLLYSSACSAHDVGDTASGRDKPLIELPAIHDDQLDRQRGLGGQLVRARAAATDPGVILWDEPSPYRPPPVPVGNQVRLRITVGTQSVGR